MRFFLFKDSVSVHLCKIKGTIRRFIGGDALLNKARNDKSLRDDFAFTYKEYVGVAVCFSMYTKTYTCTIKDPKGKGIVYAVGVTFTDLAADFINKVDINIKENKNNETVF